MSLFYRSICCSVVLATAAGAHAEQHLDAAEEQTQKTFWGVQFEELEYRYSDADGEVGVWDGDAFWGTDELKFRWQTSGEYEIQEQIYEKVENQLLVQTPISRFFDAKAGVRIDTPRGPDRVYGVLGLSGLAPYWFEVDTNLYVNEDGEASLDLDVEYELLLTNHWILVPSFDADIAFAGDRDIGVGTGLNSTELGLRVSYDLIDRAVSPYIGVVHERKWGETADWASEEGESTEDWFAVVGARLMF